MESSVTLLVLIELFTALAGDPVADDGAVSTSSHLPGFETTGVRGGGENPQLTSRELSPHIPSAS